MKGKYRKKQLTSDIARGVGNSEENSSDTQVELRATPKHATQKYIYNYKTPRAASQET